MTHYDVFNGDADGICALHQLRLADPRDAVLVTGLKRDIALLSRVPAQAGDQVTVLDISLARNADALRALLARGAQVRWFDHHHAGDPPAHPALQLVHDAAADACTSLLVNRHLGGAHAAWAVVGAFGDNLPEPASALGRCIGLDEPALAQLRALGEAINHNAYGDSEADVLIAPAALYRALSPHAQPFAFLRADALGAALIERLRDDMARVAALPERWRFANGSVFELPDQPWARRVQGMLANRCALEAPQRAHAVLRAQGDAAFMVNVRAPRARPGGTDTLCLRFGGGGRAGAGGIDHLPRAQLPAFLAAFAAAFDPGDGDGDGGAPPT